jgi:hypothetical protein
VPVLKDSASSSFTLLNLHVCGPPVAKPCVFCDSVGCIQYLALWLFVWLSLSSHGILNVCFFSISIQISRYCRV